MVALIEEFIIRAYTLMSFMGMGRIKQAAYSETEWSIYSFM
jgi:hypothetical protein